MIHRILYASCRSLSVQRACLLGAMQAADMLMGAQSPGPTIACPRAAAALPALRVKSTFADGLHPVWLSTLTQPAKGPDC